MKKNPKKKKKKEYQVFRVKTGVDDVVHIEVKIVEFQAIASWSIHHRPREPIHYPFIERRYSHF